MNAPDPIRYLHVAADAEDAGRMAVLNKFSLEAFQNLSKEDLLLAQTIAGHGDAWGVWKTPKNICPSKLGDYRRTIDIAKRLRHFLAKTPLQQTSPALIDELVDEGVFVLTRLALLMRLASTAGIAKSKSQRLKPSSISNKLYDYCPSIVAHAIRRKAVNPERRGLLSCLTEDDVRGLGKNKYLRIELERVGTLATRGCWTDLPPHPDITQSTDPSGPQSKPMAQAVPGEYKPISDRYLEEFGPRNLWLIHELGPHLLPLLEDLATHLENLDWTGKSNYDLVKVRLPEFIAAHLKDHPWVGSIGRPLKPNFPLKTGARGKDRFQFPPRNWEQLKVLSAILQSAHLFLTLLAAAGRIGEVETLPRSCVTTKRDGKDYVRGWTYKLSGNLFGDARIWPAPAVLVQTLGQQTRLANVWSRLPPVAIHEGLPKALPGHNALWLSLGGAQTANAAEPLNGLGLALRMLAERIGMDPRPGGINLHPHRLRKTIGRLAGIALFNSPTALKRLFGHKSIEMTLHYILCDKDIQTEAEAVLRELRIMHCAETLEEVRDAITSGAPLPAHSGAAASRLADAVKEHEARLSASGRIWSGGSAYDLAYLLTARGKGWRFVQKDIICAKAPGEAGLCLKNKGEPDTSNCKPGCDNRIVLALARRDADEIVGTYIDICLQALEEEQFETFYYSMGQLLKELDNFPDIKEKYLADPQLQPMLATYKELDQ
jgi:integrase